MTEKVDAIYAAVLPEMAAHDIEDTPENRASFLEGLRDGWVEDHSDDSVEKSMWVLAASMEILRLRMIRPTSHITRVVHTQDVPPYAAVCSCTWVSPKYYYGEHNAEDAAAKHLLGFRS